MMYKSLNIRKQNRMHLLLDKKAKTQLSEITLMCTGTSRAVTDDR